MTQWLVTELALLTIGILDSARTQRSQKKWTNTMIADDFLFVVFTLSVNVVLWYWEYDHAVLVT